ncbi:MAG: nucleotidyltransferase domain-containing protein [archaeon]
MAPDVKAHENKMPIPTKRDELRKIKIDREDYKTAYDLAAKIYKKFGPLVLSVVLFGSAAKGEEKKESDIDIAVIVDNVSQIWDEEVVSYYREELFKIMRDEPRRDKFHMNTVTLSTFWDNIRVGEPAILNMLRYGVALLDLGFFEPLKYLLLLGRIKPSVEAIYTVLNRTPWHMLRARVKVLSSIEDFYWAMVDSSHAALMTNGKTPPSPEHIADMLTETFVNQKRIAKVYVDWYNELYALSHEIKNHKIEHITGEQYDKWQKRTAQFVQIMEKITKASEKGYFEKFNK